MIRTTGASFVAIFHLLAFENASKPSQQNGLLVTYNKLFLPQWGSCNEPDFCIAPKDGC